ncbi:hypothetical protein STA3757_41010 [Stanieria sp. NIES-3757]|nr:hypothetical protein STA3757_41010 [Stanieria sp. NIES-3757]
MFTRKLNLQKWQIVNYSTLIIASLFVLILIFNGINELSMRIAIRATARTSCLLFLLFFVANTIKRIRTNQLTNWLFINRRYFLFSLAVSHGFHALAIIGLVIFSSPEILHNNHGGNLGYIFLIAMTATSFQTTASWLGHRSWQILHTVGMYYLWLAFIYSFIGRLGESLIIYLPFVSLLVIAIAIKLFLFFKKPSNINL